MIDEPTLNGRTAVITGGGRGIGRSIALKFVDHGTNIVVMARNEDEITSVVETIDERGGDAITVPTDVTITDDVIVLFDRARDTYGQVDILVNNTGINANETLWNLSDEEWQGVLDVNFSGTVRCIREVLTGGMLERGEGTIIIWARSGESRLRTDRTYTASKHEIQGLTKVLAKELKETEIPGKCRLSRPSEHRITDDIAAVDRLETDEIIDIVLFLATRPPSLYIPEVVAVPVDSILLIDTLIYDGLGTTVSRLFYPLSRL